MEELAQRAEVFPLLVQSPNPLKMIPEGWRRSGETARIRSTCANGSIFHSHKRTLGYHWNDCVRIVYYRLMWIIEWMMSQMYGFVQHTFSAWISEGTIQVTGRRHCKLCFMSCRRVNILHQICSACVGESTRTCFLIQTVKTPVAETEPLNGNRSINVL